MGGLLSNLRIRFQIASLTLLAVLCMAAICIGSYVSLVTLERDETAMNQAVDAKDLVDSVGTNLLQARRAEKDFLLRRADEYVVRNARAVQEAVKHTDALTRTLSGDTARKVDALRAEIDSYARRFNAVVTQQKAVGLTEKDGLLGSVRSSVHAVEGALGKFDEPRLTALMLQMRRDEKDFLARLDVKYAESMKTRTASFATALEASPMPAEARTGITAKMADYQRDFVKLVDGSLRLVAETKALSQTYAQLEPHLEELQRLMQERHAAAKLSMDASQAFALRLMLGTMAVAVLAFMVLATLVGRGISRPMMALTDVTLALANGDKERAVPGTARGDEVGDMAKAVEIFRTNAIEADRLVAERAAEQERRLQTAKRLEALVQAFNQQTTGMIRALHASAGDMEQASGSLASVAEQSRSQAHTVAAATEQTSANVQTVAASADQMAASIGEITQQVNRSASIAQQATGKAQTANTTIQSLAEQARGIGEVVELINSIAGQTNLLALNATIEAARAGEAGKGFAVVASEVKALANQTAKATEEISAQIAAMQQATGSAVSAISDISRTIAEINDIATGIAAAVEEQDAATREIARNVQQAAAGTQEVLTSIQGVQDAATHTDAAAGRVLTASQHLSRQSESLAQQVERFIRDVQAA